MKKAITIFLLLIMLVGIATGTAATAGAEVAPQREFDFTNVLDDLQSSKDEHGKAFDITEYPYDEHGRLQLITLVEYCYSYATNRRGNYALYLYIYNPKGLELDVNSPLNTAQFAVSYNEEGKPIGYDKFDLMFCNKSVGDYNNLFYKLRVLDHTGADGKTIAERVNSNLRRYDISGIEILTKGSTNADDYRVGGTYKFSGYAKGYGSDEQAESTLKCEVTELETLQTQVTGTVYRPEGSFYNGEQEQLNSVFFSVPEYFYQNYGEISAITAQWYEYRTNPIFVTENSEHAKFFDKYVGLDRRKSDFEGGLGAFIGEDKPIPGKPGVAKYKWQYGAMGGICDEERNYLSAVFDTKGSAWEDYVIGGKALQRAFLEYSLRLGGDKVNGKYSTVLFSNDTDAGHTRGKNSVKIDSDAMFSLTTYKLTQNFWQQIFGGSGIETIRYENIQAIITITADDLQGGNAEIAKRLYIGESEVNALKTEFAQGQATGKRIMLFRFATNRYESYPTIYTPKWEQSAQGGYQTYSDAYVAETAVYLDFDLIDVTFYREGNHTLIPVVSSPIDIFSPVTPPQPGWLPNSSKGFGQFIMWILIFTSVVVLIIIAVVLIKAILSRSKITVNNVPSAAYDGGKTASIQRSEQAAKRAEKFAQRAQKSAIKAKKSEKEVKRNEKQKQPHQNGGKVAKNTGQAQGGKANGKAKSPKRPRKEV